MNLGCAGEKERGGTQRLLKLAGSTPHIGHVYHLTPRLSSTFFAAPKTTPSFEQAPNLQDDDPADENDHDDEHRLRSFGEASSIQHAQRRKPNPSGLVRVRIPSTKVAIYLSIGLHSISSRAASPLNRSRRFFVNVSKSPRVYVTSSGSKEHPNRVSIEGIPKAHRTPPRGDDMQEILRVLNELANMPNMLRSISADIALLRGQIFIAAVILALPAVAAMMSARSARKAAESTLTKIEILEKALILTANARH